jgi:RNA polymerase sigma factor (sigma-70 family)
MATSQLGRVVEQLRSTVRGMDQPDLTDGELLERFLTRRDEAAFAALLKRHGPMVWGVCRRILRSYQDAEDAFQATFLVFVRKGTSVRPREMVGNWLYGVAHQTALKARATAAKRKLRERQVTAMPEPSTVPRDSQDDLHDLLDHELSRLPDKYRAAIVLCDLEGKTRREAARCLKIREGTLSSRLTTARQLLAKRLARHGGAFTGGSLPALVSQGTASAGVPPAVIAATIKTTTLSVAGQAAAGAIPAQVAALTEGVLKTMLLSRLKTLVVLVGVCGIITLGLGLSGHYGFAQPSGGEKTTEPAQRPAAAPAAANAARPDDEKSEPHYGWLVFGPQGKLRTLFRLRGEEVAVDRNNDGKFDGKGERFQSEKDCKDVVIADPDGKTSYVITSVHVMHVVPPEKFVEIRVHIRGSLDYHQGGLMQLSKDRATAGQARFHGPLTTSPEGATIANRARRLLQTDLGDLGFLVPPSVADLAGKGLIIESGLPRSLPRTGQPADLMAGVVTLGKDGIVTVCSPENTPEGRRRKSPFPKGVYPVTDVEFPPKKPGDPPIKQRYPLDQHVVEGYFRGPVRVPDEAGAGKAKVTFSFDAWKGAKVAPSTFEIPVDGPPEAEKAPLK